MGCTQRPFSEPCRQTPGHQDRGSSASICEVRGRDSIWPIWSRYGDGVGSGKLSATGKSAAGGTAGERQDPYSIARRETARRVLVSPNPKTIHDFNPKGALRAPEKYSPHSRTEQR